MSQTFSYARPGGRWRMPTEGSIGPLIVLSDSEAFRLQDYFRLNRSGWVHARQPWTIPEYGFPNDAYGGNCTAWFGHIPFGDETQTEIDAPGSIDAWGDRQGRGMRRGTLREYPLPMLPVGQEQDGDLLRRVWGAQLHTRLWDLIGVPFKEASHTNPGWVALTLTGRAPNDRVPVVFYYAKDHTKIAARFKTEIELVGG